ncbi:hypothetical protein M406DRAFT_332017 [Cryphonectria parasitica EP155]|uniref:Uncharacterized protein n=1 Tax=Cryphonectria parasitica (strain ATCC 38755 / EP155) TaxID=660469 RepID=A0A9P4XZ22_CRYP1|nr:uncharacterized protein M406DRAFT_332017 [Cryphonectria parasitica EP155]KAF3763529.1 hypothetical protein M406DRAFT_332017 [Cryphonectria parasitica EP155]
MKSTEPFPSSFRAARPRADKNCPPNPDAGQSWQSTQPFSSSFLAARLAEYTSGGQRPIRPDAGRPADQDSTQLAPASHVLASVRGRALSPGPEQSGKHQPAGDSLDQLVLRWDPRVRIVFRQTRALTIQIDRAEQQDVAVLSKPSSSGQPVWVNLLGCIQSRSEPVFSVAAGSIQCDFAYIPNCDSMVLLNLASPIEIQHVSHSDFSREVPAKGHANPQSRHLEIVYC